MRDIMPHSEFTFNNFPSNIDDNFPPPLMGVEDDEDDGV